MIVVVTGGAGFIGSHLVERMLDAPGVTRVIVVDNFFSGAHENLTHLDGRVEVVRADICDALPHVECDLIAHLACPASPIHYRRNPARTIETGVVGTRNVLRMAREVGARVVFSSTSEVYGAALEHPQREDYRGNVSTLGDRSCYDESKRAAESLCVSYEAQWRVPSRIVRLFNTIGPRSRPNDGRVVPEFCVRALAGEDIPVHGDGSQTRSFCYVDDCVEAIMRVCMRSEWPSASTVVNIGNPVETTIFELATLVQTIAREKYGKNPGIRTGLGNPVGDDPQRRCPDITRAKAMLGWEPKVGLRESIERTMAYFAERNGR